MTSFPQVASVCEHLQVTSSHNKSTTGWWRWPPRRQRWHQSQLTESDYLDETRGQGRKCLVTLSFTGWSQVRDGVNALTFGHGSWTVDLFPLRSLSCWGGRSRLQNQRSFRAVQPLLSRLRAIYCHWGGQMFIQRHHFHRETSISLILRRKFVLPKYIYFLN